MKLVYSILMISLLAAATIAQGIPYAPCIIDANPPQPVYDANGNWLGRPAPKWEPVPAWTRTYKINAGTGWHIPIVMPVAGECLLAVESYDDSEDLTKAALDAAGRYVTVKPKGDIELLVLDGFAFEERNRNRSFSTLFSSGRVFEGAFSVKLPAGYFHLVLNNRYGLVTKSVTFTMGREPRL